MRQEKRAGSQFFLMDRFDSIEEVGEEETVGVWGRVEGTEKRREERESNPIRLRLSSELELDSIRFELIRLGRS